MIELNVDGELVRVVVNAGYSGRNEESVRAHIDELANDGIEAPDAVPTTYELAPNVLLTDPVLSESSEETRRVRPGSASSSHEMSRTSSPPAIRPIVTWNVIISRSLSR